MSTRPARTSISRRAQNLFQDNTLLESSESSPEATPLSYHTHKRTSHRPPSDKLEKITNYRTTDRLGTANEGSRVNRSFVEQKSAKKSRTLISEADQQRNHSRNRSFEGKLSAKKTIKPEAAVHAGSCQKEKFLLKNRAAELQETVVKQGKKLKKFYKQIVGKREEINKLTDQLIASKQKTGIILELQEKAKAAQENENNLMIYLREQQKVAKEALSKLHELQEESINEIERAKQYYKEYYQKQSDEDRVHYEDRLQRSELERERLISMIKDLEITLNTEKSYSSKSSILSEEVAILKSQLNEKVVEIERLRFENRGLKHSIEENKQLASMEIKDLKYELEMLNEHSRTMKTQEEEIYNKENASLRRNLEDLEQQLYEKDRLLHEKDATYRDQVGVINQKVLNLQSELRKLTEYEEKIERLNKEVMFKDEEVQMVKKYYKEKMDKTKAKQKEQKREWSGIYNELLGEIKQLKGDIDALGHENKRLITSIKAKSIRDGY